MPSFSNIRPMWIIHSFALLHAVVALSCRLAGIEDELLLTFLTMTMVLLVCFRKNFNIEFTAAVIIVSNILGYLLGTVGASILEMFIRSPYAVHAVSTAVTTEILGWCVVGISKLFPKIKSGNKLTSSSVKWTLFAAAGIFILRFAIVSIYSQQSLSAEKVFELTSKVLSNSVGIIVLVCLNLLFIRNLTSRYKDWSKLGRIAAGCGFMIVCSALETLLAGSGFPFRMHFGFMKDFLFLFPVCMLTQITVYCLVYIINYAVAAKTEMRHEREKANMAQYRYMKLKGQVNPHFLFNSLNILDCLVCEEKNEQASTYIHKLAGIYRYMIKSEDEDIVPLRDEMAFVNQYVDLLRLRFPEGFDVEINVPEKDMSRYVLPCAVQLLIENATKHNAVTAANPLKITIEVIGDRLRASNNIVPKITRVESTGLGHKYIRQQYMDLSGKSIEIENDGKNYSVTLPLL
ncbi:MAG: histidine kinase [Bacteroidales bacterium]|nr:histidine kinase [Bacteroidales bacterium]